MIGLLRQERGSIVVDDTNIIECSAKELNEIRALFGVLLTSDEPVVRQFVNGRRIGPIGMSEEKGESTMAEEQAMVDAPRHHPRRYDDQRCLRADLRLRHAQGRPALLKPEQLLRVAVCDLVPVGRADRCLSKEPRVLNGIAERVVA